MVSEESGFYVLGKRGLRMALFMLGMRSGVRFIVIVLILKKKNIMRIIAHSICLAKSALIGNFMKYIVQVIN